jgi:tetratricopeptide (TPR) repeat protein
MQKGDYDKAIADFTKAISLKNDYVFAYNNRGNVKYKQKKYDEAIADYDQAIKLDPSYGYAYLNRGISKEMLRDELGACTDWKKAYSLGIEVAQNYIKGQCN